MVGFGIGIGDADERCQIKMHYMAGSRGNLRQWLVDLLHRSSTAGVGFHDVTTYIVIEGNCQVLLNTCYLNKKLKNCHSHIIWS